MTTAEYRRWRKNAVNTGLFDRKPEYEFAVEYGIIRLTDLPSWYGDDADADDDDESDDESENEDGIK